MSGKYWLLWVTKKSVQLSLRASWKLLPKHISKSTAITSVQWHAIYMALPREINFEVTTHKINNSERNSGHSSKERNSIITGHELQYSASPAEEFSPSLDYWYRFVWRSAFASEELSIRFTYVLTKNFTLELKHFQGFLKQTFPSFLKSFKYSLSTFCLYSLSWCCWAGLLASQGRERELWTHHYETEATIMPGRCREPNA